jgi:AcrR family transcriptional regulator
MASTAPRATYHHGDLRNAFMRAALGLVSTRGVHAVSLREAAREIGVSPSAAYRHFTDKEALLDAVADDGTRRLAEEMKVAGSAARMGREGACATVAVLWAYADAVLDFAVRNSAHWRVMAVCKDRRRPQTDAGSLALEAFDELIELGIIEASQRDRGLIAAWAGVYGLGFLLVEGMAGKETDAGADCFRRGALDAVLRTTLLGIGVDEALLPPPRPFQVDAVHGTPA